MNDANDANQAFIDDGITKSLFSDFMRDINNYDYERQVSKYSEIVNLLKLLKKNHSNLTRIKLTINLFTSHCASVSPKLIMENKEFFLYMINQIIDDIENIDDMKGKYSCHMTLKSNLMRSLMCLSNDYESEKELIKFIEEQVDFMRENTIQLMKKIQ